MKKSIILQVQDKKTDRLFWQMPWRVYQADEQYCAPLITELKKVLNKSQNPYFSQGGDVKRWLLIDNQQQPIGRIAAFFNHKDLKKGTPTGRIGFFECIQHYESANLLFDAAEHWLKQQGCERVEGPINAGGTENWWGLLIEGFTSPALGTPYNPAYYQDLFENAGYKENYRQISKWLDLTQPLPERIQKIAERVYNKPGLTFKNADLNHLKRMALDLMEIYNDAWSEHPLFMPFTEPEVFKTAQSMRAAIIEPLIVFAYVDDDPAGFFVALPDLNQIFKAWKGQITLWRGLTFMWKKRNNFLSYFKSGQLTHARFLVMGVKEKYRKMGLESGLILKNYAIAQKLGLRTVELSWVGDFNTGMLPILDAVGAKDHKIHLTYFKSL